MYRNVIEQTLFVPLPTALWQDYYHHHHENNPECGENNYNTDEGGKEQECDGYEYYRHRGKGYSSQETPKTKSILPSSTPFILGLPDDDDDEEEEEEEDEDLDITKTLSSEFLDDCSKSTCSGSDRNDCFLPQCCSCQGILNDPYGTCCSSSCSWCCQHSKHIPTPLDYYNRRCRHRSDSVSIVGRMTPVKFLFNRDTTTSKNNSIKKEVMTKTSTTTKKHQNQTFYCPKEEKRMPNNEKHRRSIPPPSVPLQQQQQQQQQKQQQKQKQEQRRRSQLVMTSSTKVVMPLSPLKVWEQQIVIHNVSNHNKKVASIPM